MTDETQQSDNYYRNSQPYCVKQLSIRQDLSNFIEEQARVFNARLIEARRVIKQFTALYESISDPEIRDTMEAAAAGIKDKLRIILTGINESNSKTSQTNRKTMTLKKVSHKKPEKVIDLTTTQTRSDMEKRPTNQDSMANETKNQTKKTAQSSWTEVIRRNPKTHTKPTQIAVTRTVANHKPVTSAITVEETKQDERLFLRVRVEHAWRRMSPHYVKLSLAAKLKTASSVIEKVTVVNSGFAVTAASEAARNLLLQEARVLKDLDMKLEPASKWVSVLAANVPDRLNTLNGVIPVTAEMVSEETSLKTGVRPTSVRAFVSSL
ncbi:putative eka-like protein [Erysiphe necator]|uniref:Putative eka-like protein n=1 Tax=Uncinula necator TaxID=52586 RepID=A0A0B1P856_UNCNE|nr:putative eka-like protein [Erysiphe necator]